jgi:hypothetical protein
MKFSEICSRLTGFSIPIFGVQWAPPEAEVTAARRVIAFLEDRRVLYVPSEMESPHHCVDSVLRMRENLTQEIGKLGDESSLAESLRGMRAACRKFLSIVEGDNGRIMQHANSHGHYASWIFNSALGELRGVFGIYIAQIAASNGLDIEDDLAAIVPGRAE